jgi:hypothetical protein
MPSASTARATSEATMSGTRKERSARTASTGAANAAGTKRIATCSATAPAQRRSNDYALIAM